MIISYMMFDQANILSRKLLPRHFSEVGFNGLSDERLDVWNDFYRYIEKDGRLIIVTATKENNVIGYISAVVSPHPHHKHLKFAMTDTLYLAPEYRKCLNSGRVACRMIKMVEARAKELGASYLQLVANANYSIDSLADHLGYQMSDVVYCKRIK